MAELPRCSEARELVPEVALGIAPAEDRVRLLWHVAGCVACRDLLLELSALCDELLALIPEQEPPGGFETQVLARIADQAPRSLPWRTWRRIALFAAALVITAAVSGGAVYRAHTPDRELAASVRATLATANGQYFATAPLHGADDQRRGVAFGYQGDPAWVLVTVSPSERFGPYAVEVVTHSGVSRRLADDLDLARTGAWGGTSPIAIHEIAAVRVLDANGRPILSGHFPLPSSSAPGS